MRDSRLGERRHVPPRRATAPPAGAQPAAAGHHPRSPPARPLPPRTRTAGASLLVVRRQESADAFEHDGKRKSAAASALREPAEPCAEVRGRRTVLSSGRRTTVVSIGQRNSDLLS